MFTRHDRLFKQAQQGATQAVHMASDNIPNKPLWTASEQPPDEPVTQPQVDDHQGIVDDLEGPPTVPTLQPPPDARELRDSRLRAENESVTLSPPSTSILMAREQSKLSFTGTGSEYFRIWLVNLALTIVTLGVYSAWAKVRRLQYFYRATSLEGVCFDYSAKPTNILAGRVIALGLFGVYYLAYNFMPELGALVIIVVVAVLPYLLRQSHRFKARNTLHRSVAFHFDGTVAAAYQTYLPPLIVLFAPSVVASLVFSEKGGLWVIALSLAGLVAWPFFHATFRRFMQRNLRYGDAAFGFDATNKNFFTVWAKGIVLSIVVGFLFTLAIFAFGAFFAFVLGSSTRASAVGFIGGLSGVLAAYLAYSCIGSYYTARFQKLVWEHTALGEISFKCNLSATALLKRQFINTVLIICTLGLYRPFAAINIAKLRLESMTVVGTERLDEFFAAPDKNAGGAIGEGTAELFDMDVSF
jgi:uncharacterized membrane protein YjgN (DUF898 family)